MKVGKVTILSPALLITSRVGANPVIFTKFNRDHLRFPVCDVSFFLNNSPERMETELVTL